MLNKVAGAVLVTLMVGGCALAPPIVTFKRVNGGFEHYVPKVYPVGSDARLLEDRLKAEDFVVTEEALGRFSAEHPTVCYCKYRVKWSVDRGGRIADISAEDCRCPGP